jgi:secreted PhoX family phosphatase
MRRRWNRRELLAGGGALAAASLVGCDGGEAPAGVPGQTAPAVFSTIAASAEDRVIVPEGFVADVLIRWGDPVVPGSIGLPLDGIPTGSLLAPGAGVAQSQCFGTNCDGMGVFRVSDDRIVICINHELPEPGRMFAGWTAAGRERRTLEFVQQNPELVAVMQSAVGLCVLEFERVDGRWQFVADSPLNRRITANTPMEMAGPAAHHPWLGGSETEVGHCLGTFGNCAANETPWGTYLTAEENTNDFFGNGANAEWDPLLLRANERFSFRRGPSLFRWEVVDERFDHAKHPSESMKFGWIVELDPMNPTRPIRKRTALGKFRHEGAMTVLNSERRPVVYMGDDSGFEYFYKFVADRSYDPASPEGTDTLLDSGTLYVAKLNDDGSGEWLPLVHGSRPELSESNDFASQADVVMRCREAADLVGATPLDRPEDVAVHPRNGRVYLACTQGTQRGLRLPPAPADANAATTTAAAGGAAAAAEEPPGYPAPDAANPRGPNPYGHILEFIESGDDAAALTFRWEVFLLAGDPAEEGLASSVIAGRLAPAVAYYAGRSDSEGLSAFANPDNLGFDPAGNLWIVTDGTQPDDNNNGCFVCPTEGLDRGLVRQFMSGPVGAEISGATFSPDGETLFINVQHPGSGSSIEEPNSHWPDGGDAQPRSSLIAIRSTDPLKRFYL